MLLHCAAGHPVALIALALFIALSGRKSSVHARLESRACHAPDLHAVHCDSNEQETIPHVVRLNVLPPEGQGVIAPQS